MIKDLVQKRWFRWMIFLMIGILVKFLLDVTYSLIYRNYPLFQPLLDYVYAITLAIVALEVNWTTRKSLARRILWEEQPYKRFFVQWAVTLVISLVVVYGSSWLYTMLVNTAYYVNLLNEIILGIMILLVVASMNLFELGLFLLEKWRFSLAELERFKKENAEFQFESLRAQVNPHFLFNSLNTLSSLVYESREKAEAFIRELSDVYRYILENRGNELVEFGKELEVARSYIYLVHLRFEENLNINVDVDESYYNQLIAPLTLQLLIENAVKHNIISQRKPLMVNVFIENQHVVVKNNLQRKTSKEYSSQLGLKNIRSRYSFLTDQNMEVIETTEEFIVKVPIIKAK